MLWRDGVALLPTIDHTGAVGTDGPITARTITTIMSHRRIPTGQTEKLGPLLAPVGRYRIATPHELVTAQDEVLDQLDTANAYLAELLTEAEAISTRMK